MNGRKIVSSISGMLILALMLSSNLASAAAIDPFPFPGTVIGQAPAPLGPMDYTGSCFNMLTNYSLTQNMTFTSGNCSVFGQLNVSAPFTLTLRDTTLRLGTAAPSTWGDINVRGGKLILNHSVLMNNTDQVGWSGTVEQGGELRISSNSLFIGGKNPGATLFNVMNPSKLSVKDGTFTKGDDYFFVVNSASNIEFINNNFADVGTSAISMDQVNGGTFLNNRYSNVTTAGSWKAAVMVLSGSSLRFDGERFSNNTIGFGNVGGEGVVIGNTTFAQDVTSDIWLEGGSSVYLHKTPYKTSILDTWGSSTSSQIFSREYVNVSVRWESDMAPLAWGVVGIFNDRGDKVLGGVTDATGTIKGIEIYTRIEDVFGPGNQTPHTFQVESTRGGKNYLRSVTQDLAANQSVNIVIDDILPSLNVTEPIEGLVTNATVVRFGGNTDRPVIGKNVTIDINNSFTSFFPAMDANGSFAIDIPLEYEGENKVTVTARDDFDNKASIILNLTRDTITPELTISDPMEGDVVNIRTIDVKGTTEPGAALWIDSVPVTVGQDGAFLFVLTIAEGTNIIELRAKDRAGNENRTTVNITLDSGEPDITITEPRTFDVLTSEPRFKISGLVSPDTVQVTLNDVPVTLENASFTTYLWLYEGTQQVVVSARDRADNIGTVTMTVTLDPWPPILIVTGPEDGYTVTTPTITVMGITDHGSDLKIDGEYVDVGEDGAFSFEKWLEEGLNPITIRSTDAAGNEAVANLTVIRDTLGPNLDITSPVGGTVTSQNSVTIKGRTETGAFVLVAGKPATLNANSFSVEVPLDREGRNDIEVSAMDHIGNVARTSIWVVRDTRTFITIMRPIDNTTMKTTDIVVNGTTEIGSTVTVNDRDVAVDARGNFQVTLALIDGPNFILVTTRDSVGNEKTVGLNITIDTTGGGGDDEGDQGNARFFAMINAYMLPVGAAMLIIALLGSVYMLAKRRDEEEMVELLMKERRRTRGRHRSVKEEDEEEEEEETVDDRDEELGNEKDERVEENE